MFVLHEKCYEPALQAWKQGQAFYTGVDPFEAPITIKLGEVVAISCRSAEQMAEAERAAMFQ